MVPNPSSLEAMNLKEPLGEASDSWLPLEDALAKREVSLEERPWNGFEIAQITKINTHIYIHTYIHTYIIIIIIFFKKNLGGPLPPQSKASYVPASCTTHGLLLQSKALIM